MANALAKINARIKQLKKAHPKMTHRAAQQKASAEYKRGALGKVAKKAAPKKTVVKKAKTVIIAGAKKSARKKTIKTPLGNFSIGKVAMSSLSAEVQKKERYERELKKLIKDKAPMQQKNAIRRLIATTKQHITRLKRSI